MCILNIYKHKTQTIYPATHGPTTKMLDPQHSGKTRRCGEKLRLVFYIHHGSGHWMED